MDALAVAKFRSAYEIYAHVMIAERRGLSDDKLATIVAGQRPPDLARDEAIAYDVASALVDHGAARANVPPGRSDIRPTRRRRAHLFGWALLPCIRHAQRIRRAGTRGERRVIGLDQST